MNKTEKTTGEKTPLNTAQAMESFAAMAQETRLNALRLLVQAGKEGLCAGDLSRSLDVAHNNLSFHLSQLLEANLVTVEKQGRKMIYRAQFQHLNALIAFLTAECCQGATCDLNATPKNPAPKNQQDIVLAMPKKLEKNL